MNQKLYNCVFIKSILMLLVILYHSTVFWNGNWFTVEPVAFQSTILGVFSQWLNSFHIYAFILVSGYIFAFKMSGGGTQVISSSLKIRPKGFCFRMLS